MTIPQYLMVALVQQACTHDHQANLDASIEGIERAADEGARVVVLQELHSQRYFCQHEDPAGFDLAESIPGSTTERLAQTATALDIVIICSVFEKRAPGIYHNSAVVLDVDGTIAGIYRKMHIPDDPGYYEKYYFTPGDLGFAPVQTRLGRMGVLVCWDQWFPEAARLMALAGAQILFYPTAIGWDPRDDEQEKQRQRDAWLISQRAHAIANGIPVITCNRVGHEADPSGQSPGIEFWGSSFVAGPQGEILAMADVGEPQILTAELDFHHVESVRRIWPFFRDRRIDAYADLLKRYRDE